MSWIGFALLGAFCAAFEDTLIKRAAAGMDPFIVAWAVSFTATILLWCVVAGSGLPILQSPPQWILLLLAVSGLLNILLKAMSVGGLQRTDLSLAGPLQATTPAFLLVLSPPLLREIPSVVGALGVLVIVLGSFLLNVGARARGLLAPLRQLVHDRGSRLILGAAFVAAFSSVVDKHGLRVSSPIVWAAGLTSVMTLGLSAIVFVKQPDITRVGRGSQWAVLLGAGALLAVGAASTMQAFHLGLVPYAIALKRLSGPIEVVIGRLAFAEADFRGRIVGAFVILAGVLMIALAG